MSTRKEVQKEEAEKKEIPPSPPIGRKGEEEKEPPSSARARTDNWIGETPPNGPINLTKPPEGPPRAVVAAYLEAGGWRTRRGGVSTS